MHSQLTGKEEYAIDNELLKKLYDRYRNEIYLYLYSLCRDPELAEDLTQSTFLNALLSLSNDHINMRAWLYMVARNLYFNQCKKEKRTVRCGETQLDNDMTSPNTIPFVLKLEQEEMLMHALSCLNTTKREILQMHYLSGLSHNEIASILRISPANVRVLALRAKRELKQYMEEHNYDIP